MALDCWLVIPEVMDSIPVISTRIWKVRNSCRVPGFRVEYGVMGLVDVANKVFCVYDALGTDTPKEEIKGTPQRITNFRGCQADTVSCGSL